MKLFVGNIGEDVTEDELKQTFAQFGKVQEAKIVFDKYTRESRNFAFVKMADPASALSAIKKLNGKKYKGKRLQVNEARTRVRACKGENRRNGPPKYK
jgi:RNA recognition motif-containing protein